VSSARAKAVAGAYFNCPQATIGGIELEDEGGDGTAGSHIDRRFAKNALMAGISGGQLTAFELAILEDYGPYLCNYDKADPSYMAKGMGCNFRRESCATAAGGLGRYWCFDASVGCVTSLKEYGPCGQSLGSSYTQLTNGCPYFVPYSNRDCQDTANSNVASTGDSFASNARCFKATDGFRQTGSGIVPAVNHRCLLAQCTSAGKVQLRPSSVASWVTCNTAGSTVTVPGYDGLIYCPADLAEMCASLASTEQDVSWIPTWVRTHGSVQADGYRSGAGALAGIAAAVGAAVAVAALLL